MAAGFEQSRFRPQGWEGARAKLEGFCTAVEEALAIASKDLDRLIVARELMNRVTAQCRSNSRLPELVKLFLSRPLVMVPLGAWEGRHFAPSDQLPLHQLNGLMQLPSFG